MAKNTIRNSMYFLLCVFLRSYRIWLLRVYCVGVISIRENVTNLASLDFAKFSRISIIPTHSETKFYTSANKMHSSKQHLRVENTILLYESTF